MAVPVPRNAEVGGTRKEPCSPHDEGRSPRAERQAGSSLPARRDQADHGQRQEPPYLPGELLVEQPQRSRLAVLADASRSALRGASLVCALSVGRLLGGLPVSSWWRAPRPVAPPEQTLQAVVAEGQVERRVALAATHVGALVGWEPNERQGPGERHGEQHDRRDPDVCEA